jgi:hypothetical protein
MDEKAKRYATRGHRSVHGWLTDAAAGMIVSLAAVQETRSVSGGCCEIGVHEGRLFVLLALLLREGERALAVDLFELQDENEDASGYGSRERLRTSLAAHGAPLDRVEILAENSMRLTADRVGRSVGPVRLFSVDGGHTADLTRNDLEIAAASVCDGGLVILDDFMSPQWPGVTEGACAFMQRRQLAPVAFLGNKLVLAKGDAAPYVAAIGDTETVQMFGSPCKVRHPLSMRERLARTELWRKLRTRSVGKLLRRLVHA